FLPESSDHPSRAWRRERSAEAACLGLRIDGHPIVVYPLSVPTDGRATLGRNSRCLDLSRRAHGVNLRLESRPPSSPGRQWASSSLSSPSWSSSRWWWATVRRPALIR